MSDDTCAGQLSRILEDAATLDAMRREHAADLVACVERLGLDGFVRAWLLGHAAEIDGAVEHAAARYAEALHIIAGHRCPAASIVRPWLQLALQVVRARLADPRFDPTLVTPCIHAPGIGTDHTAILLAQLATARAAIVLDRPGVSPSRGDIQRLAAMLEDASTQAEAIIEAAEGRARIAAAEPFGPLYMSVFRTLLRGDAGAIPYGRERAWSWFRVLRQSLDLLPGDPIELEGIPAGTMVLELLAPPGDPLHVCLTSAGERDFGTCSTTVAEAADLQYTLGERLRAICQPAASGAAAVPGAPVPTDDTVVALCEWTYDSAVAWSKLLLARPITWSSGTTQSLQDRLVATGARRLCILPHGPVHIAPWGLLRHDDGDPWIDRWAITLCTSWRAAPRDHDGDAGWVVRRNMPLDERDERETAHLPSSDDAAGLFLEMAGARRAWLAGHGLFLPATHGDSTLETVGTPEVLSLGLGALLDEARRVCSTPLRAPSSIALSICEAAEVSRRAFLTELVTLAHVFLVAGATTVLAPKWSTTNIGDDALSAWLDHPAPLAAIARHLLSTAYATWRACRDRREVAELAATCRSRRLLPLCDIGAFDVHGYITPDLTNRSLP